MKKSGVINKLLIEQIAGLGHTDSFLLCDSGFPIPKSATLVDLALCFGIPSMEQCLKTILDEFIAEKVTIANEMKEFNAQGYQFVKTTFKNQEFVCVPQNELIELAKNVKFIVRTGELAPYSNIIVQSASGVPAYNQNLAIEME